MRGDKVSGGYEAAFLYTEQHRDVVLAAMHAREWFKRYRTPAGRVSSESQGRVRAEAVESTGFAGHKGWRIVVPTLREEEAVQHVENYALLALYKPGDRIRTLVPLHRWGRPTERPAGALGVITRIEAGDLFVRWDGEEQEWNCAPRWFEVVER